MHSLKERHDEFFFNNVLALGYESRELAILTILKTARSQIELDSYLKCMYPADVIKECRSISNSFNRGTVGTNCEMISDMRISLALDGREDRVFDRMKRFLPISYKTPPSQKYGTRIQDLDSALSTSTEH